MRWRVLCVDVHADELVRGDLLPERQGPHTSPPLSPAVMGELNKTAIFLCGQRVSRVWREWGVLLLAVQCHVIRMKGSESREFTAGSHDLVFRIS
jgi:hypothetical protein